ncbi:hypothetical protein SAMD00019534_108230 [Acytostelium subglobosum LB1]|uniref:hypothetical protein n=1 Tax=Acytostelium subglobosum LB1 TaxID=1410327 RepID=UPI000644B652|nr:hypothetical protein SAMD00019534_108230 [Acytostelium subglobosum LB1]GAM27647.1 hypothetical protein SAMD00019534_108230 [Acytostelium subglobosum LB1]|eukprot:XP_012749306.1 hypothetical protein SAMD00019534_108230 [Acytostelium subglobosum LB1]
MNINDYKNWSKDELLQWFTEQTKEDVKVQAKILHQQDIKGADLPLTSANLKEVGCTLGQANAVLRVLEQLPLVPAAGATGGAGHANVFGSFAQETYQTEGIDIESVTITKRTETLNEVYRQLSEKRVLLLRSPPFSGKTSFCTLLSQYLQSMSVDVIKYRLRLPPVAMDDEMVFFKQDWEHITKQSWEYWLDQGTATRARFIIIDEAQIAYRKDYMSFWLRIKELMDVKNNALIHILLVATYGDAETDRATPVEFGVNNSLDLSDLLLTRSEFLELVTNFNDNHNRTSGVTLNGDALEYLWKITRGHVGIIRLALQLLDTFAADKKSPLDSDDIIFYFISLPFNMRIAETRAIPKQQLSDAETDIVSSILLTKGAPFKHTYESTSSQLEALKHLIKIGVLVDITLDRHFTKLYFASPIFRGIYFIRCFGAQLVGKASLVSLKEYIKTVLERIDHKSIKTT